MPPQRQKLGNTFIVVSYVLALAAFFYIGQKVSTLSYLAEGYLKFIYTHAARLREIGGAGGLKRALNIGLPEKEAVAGLLIFASAIAMLVLNYLGYFH
ncbi:hypothetical protein GCM10007108_05040 [Thermogymnomonas acidicola]|uniref:Uncharacterized protein n=1 Tax=Thermogymnomonas acidicola TaxID=399579 RepID=A0AA37BQF1_9ARCH|nr:hypothetical protein [Thermogymnomonas acidicola]GGM69953.1 hypothetical protein GCM10007108_05040 [Thermogymnomonas acidicola]